MMCSASRQNCGELSNASQVLIALVKSAADEITNHGQEFVEIFSLGRHFRLVTGRHQRVAILFDLKHELFLHAIIVPHKPLSGKSLLPSNSGRGCHDCKLFEVLRCFQWDKNGVLVKGQKTCSANPVGIAKTNDCAHDLACHSTENGEQPCWHFYACIPIYTCYFTIVWRPRALFFDSSQREEAVASAAASHGSYEKPRFGEAGNYLKFPLRNWTEFEWI